jgi:hypothetical protein
MYVIPLLFSFILFRFPVNLDGLTFLVPFVYFPGSRARFSYSILPLFRPLFPAPQFIPRYFSALNTLIEETNLISLLSCRCETVYMHRVWPCIFK